MNIYNEVSADYICVNPQYPWLIVLQNSEFNTFLDIEIDAVTMVKCLPSDSDSVNA